ncbi:MAG TPA: peptide chain release factor N(5)-glutamine methyltransferase [Candidatus Brachybacterium merdavium]|uniref:Release factor glutamine methyltransferase n=1 Tax=Candidatus Brachybacterium merdavium TaxID=2838513 RepID=A0A9D2LDA6_9MICO|nr:peptide chain release factor N(5)-glutamine methyltransferase [Candidatus Brachybacterium merdavium]
MTESPSLAADPRIRLRRALAETTERLSRAGVPSPSADARALIARAARTDRSPLLLDRLPERFADDLEQLTERRTAREPLQLILGEAPFRRLMLRVEPGVFIPRPETELALDLLRTHADRPPERVADLCTGSGALGAAALDELPTARVLAVDIDPRAVDLARRNLERAGPGRGRVLQADLTDPAALAGQAGFDAVLSNPPYVPSDAVPRDQEVRDHDPRHALYGGGQDGLDLPRLVIARAAALLRQGGTLIMEHADVQGEAARALATTHGGFEQIETAADLTGRDRFLIARRVPDDQPDGSERLTR